ncbi:hypothetical protein GUJ93_ZPchr0001g30056 [Zizania palustris]|uniref:Dihydroorotase n=1 Tax=Zizania palustris TaxID=103762 RepID=A0A8J5RSQ6_ZIZPA|nr:hypothetical protein GUJ93_ZPchr0001g30056 [Zizania palustris]
MQVAAVATFSATANPHRKHLFSPSLRPSPSYGARAHLSSIRNRTSIAMAASTSPTTQELIITRPDDWHLHLRDGYVLAAVLLHSARHFGRAIVMPNLKPPVTTTARALEYREDIIRALPALEQLCAAHDALPHGQYYPGGDQTRKDGQARNAFACQVAATVTPQHLLLNRNALFQGGLQPHNYCIPVLKRETHRQAIVSAAGALDKLEAFTSFNGPDFYGLPRNTSKIVLRKSAWKVPDTYSYSSGEIVPMYTGNTLEWLPSDHLEEGTKENYSWGKHNWSLE